MDIHFLSLTVCFEPPFWVGVFEQIERGARSASRVTFGAKAERLRGMGLRPEARLSTQIQSICRRRHSAGGSQSQTGTANAAAKQTAPGRIGTKSQQALQLQRDASKQEQKMCTQEQQETEKQRRFALRQQQRKEKHRGHCSPVLFRFYAVPSISAAAVLGADEISHSHSQRQKQPRMQCIRGCLIYASSGSGRSTMIASWWTAGRILSSTSCVAMASVDELMHGWQPIMRDSAMGLSMTS